MNHDEEPLLSETQTLGKLDSRRGGYFFVTVVRAFADSLPNGKKTRLLCELNGIKTLRCGLNPIGNGDFFILVSTATAKELGIGEGSRVEVSISVDPDQLGVEMPEAFEELLAQEPEMKSRFDSLTDGKKRSLIHQLSRIRDIDRQVMKAVALLTGDERIGPPSRRKQ